jgi:acyl dehydratase
MEFVAEYTTKDLILYALAIGFGSSGEDDQHDELRYVFEHHSSFSAVPSFPLVLPFWADKSQGSSQTIKRFPPPMMKAVGVLPNEYLKANMPENLPVIHTSQSITWHRPVPTPRDSSGTLTHLTTRVFSIVPKSVGTFVTNETQISSNGSVACTLKSTNLILGMPSEDVIPFGDSPRKRQWHQLLDQDPVFEWTYATVPTQALMYRIASGDTNTIHVDSSSLSIVGESKRPLLHGLCTLGILVRGIMRYLRDRGSEFSFTGLDVDFAKPVFVGDSLVVQIWEEVSRELNNGGDIKLLLRVLNSETGDLIIEPGLVNVKSGEEIGAARL